MSAIHSLPRSLFTLAFLSFALAAIGLMLAASPARGDAMHDAAKNGDLGQIEELIAQGESAEYVEPISGLSPVHWAARNGHADAVALLIDNGGPVASRDTERGYTPLHWPAARGHIAVVNLLIANGADVNARAKSDTR